MRNKFTMKTISAVICELNPAHKGHEFIINEAKKLSDCVVAIMSGNFVQRAETAIFDKYKRAEAAIKIGADIVLELPMPWSSASAEFFAMAGVSIAEKLSCDKLVFGSECGDVNAIKRAAEILSREEFNTALQPDVRAAELRAKMLNDADPELPAELLSSANDILGIEYCKNAVNLEIHPVKRISCDSATKLRSIIKCDIENHEGAVDVNKLFELEFIKYRTSIGKSMDFAESNGGVGARLSNSAFHSKSADEMFELSKTKQYTNARLRRAALFNLLSVTCEMIREKPEFTVLLAANDKGREYLSDIRRKSEITILTKPSDGIKLEGSAKRQFEFSAFADTVFALCAKKESDYFIKKSPYILK